MKIKEEKLKLLKEIETSEPTSSYRSKQNLPKVHVNARNGMKSSMSAPKDSDLVSTKISFYPH